MAAIQLPPYKQIAFIFQGGGALGAYQAGVYEGLSEAAIEPTWVSGISIGSINAAIVAGNPPEKRVEQLRKFWKTISRPRVAAAQGALQMANLMAWGGLGRVQEDMRSAVNQSFGSFAAWMALTEGQKGFFTPRPFAPGVGAPSDVSFYETSELKSTLESVIDFDRINHKCKMRVSLGATNVETGNFVYFDNRDTKIRAEHVMASGALPPGFPAVEIDGAFYWDGGSVSNTPLLYVMTHGQNCDTLAFQVDLWSARGSLPSNIFEVNERQKDIQYSSRTRTITDAVRNVHKMRKLLLDTLEHIPKKVREADPYFQQVKQYALGSRFNVIQVIYQNKDRDGYYKDYEFSFESMQRHWAIGLSDISNSLTDPSALALPQPGENFVTYDVHRKARYTPASPDPQKAAIPQYAFQSTDCNKP